jgi:hypothetical protein
MKKAVCTILILPVAALFAVLPGLCGAAEDPISIPASAFKESITSYGQEKNLERALDSKVTAAVLAIYYNFNKDKPETARFKNFDEWRKSEDAVQICKREGPYNFFVYTSGADGKRYIRFMRKNNIIGRRLGLEQATVPELDKMAALCAVEMVGSRYEGKTGLDKIASDAVAALNYDELGVFPSEMIKNRQALEWLARSGKEEFETAAEHRQRLEAWEQPYTGFVSLLRYNADMGAFEAEFRGEKFLVPVPRDRAREMSQRKGDMAVTGRLKYGDALSFKLFSPQVLDRKTNMRYPLVRSLSAGSLASHAPPGPVPIRPAAPEKPAVNIRNVPDFHAKARGNDYAVIIGIEKYKDLPPSDYSRDDAALVREYFRALGFRERNIELITDSNATRSAMEKALEAWLPNRLKTGGRVFVYYSGHGAPDPVTGEAYLVPYDGDPGYLAVTGYPLRRLYDALGKLRAAEVTVLLDCCFSGAGGRSVLTKGARPLVMLVETGTLAGNIAVLSAAQGAQISMSSPEKGHGIFTYHFLGALVEGKKGLADIYYYMKPLVEDDAKALNVRQSPSIRPEPEKIRGRFNIR